MRIKVIQGVVASLVLAVTFHFVHRLRRILVCDINAAANCACAFLCLGRHRRIPLPRRMPHLKICEVSLGETRYTVATTTAERAVQREGTHARAHPLM